MQLYISKEISHNNHVETINVDFILTAIHTVGAAPP